MHFSALGHAADEPMHKMRFPKEEIFFRYFMSFNCSKYFQNLSKSSKIEALENLRFSARQIKDLTDFWELGNAIHFLKIRRIFGALKRGAFGAEKRSIQKPTVFVHSKSKISKVSHVQKTPFFANFDFDVCKSKPEKNAKHSKIL